MSETITVTLKVWRQNNPDDKGHSKFIRLKILM